MLGSTLIEFFTDSPHLMEEFAKRQLASRAKIPRWKDGWLRRALDFAEKPIKGEGHSKKCIFLVITNKKFILSKVTHRSFSFKSAFYPKKLVSKEPAWTAAILKQMISGQAGLGR